MTDTAQNPAPQQVTGDRLMYVLPLDAVRSATQPVIQTRDLWIILGRDKWMLLGVMIFFIALGLAYGLFAPKLYRADVVMISTHEKSTQGLVERFGGLASLAGLNAEGGARAEPLAVLRSKEFARDFIDRKGLLPVLFASKWDDDAGTWEEKDPSKQPDLRDAVRFFDMNVRTVEVDPKTGLIRLSIQWKDAKLAAEWAKQMVDDINGRMRERALEEATRNVAYLRSEMAATAVVELKQSIGRLLETEMQKLMLARGNNEYSFRVVDRAYPPKRPAWPNLPLVIVLSVVLGAVTGAGVILLRSGLLSTFSSRS